MPEITILLQEIEWILLFIFAFFTLILLFYYWFFYARLAFAKTKKLINQTHTQCPPVSVIICARNEFVNLSNNLLSVLQQDYPDFEVIVVNDFSEDDTYFLLKSFQGKYDHFRFINLQENVNFFSGKKLALALGIKSAKNNIVLLTDADCKPDSDQWIRNMSKHFVNEQVSIVLGYGGYYKKPGFLSALIRFDTVNIAIQYMSFAMAGKPYMGVGRNLAYKRDLFFKLGGFISHYKIKSGDDDLFINKAAKSRNTSVAIEKDSFTMSLPKRTFASWFKQKKRHLSTSGMYKFSDKFLLGLFGLSHTFFYISLAAFLIYAQWSLALLIALGLFLIKLISLMLLYYYAGKKYNEPKLFLYSPLLDVVFAFLNPIFAISNLVYRKNTWK
jgi:cellulose synthase/poly-beta-1,6-N-acetylglucosamine synthase-like glycosyltransferase